jgi:hypothetical protein
LQEFIPQQISFDEKTAVLDLLQNPTTRAIFFKTQGSFDEILPSVQIPGFKYLELTDADNRLGWVVLEEGIDMQFALASLQDIQAQVCSHNLCDKFIDAFNNMNTNEAVSIRKTNTIPIFWWNFYSNKIYFRTSQQSYSTGKRFISHQRIGCFPRLSSRFDLIS